MTTKTETRVPTTLSEKGAAYFREYVGRGGSRDAAYAYATACDARDQARALEGRVLKLDMAQITGAMSQVLLAAGKMAKDNSDVAEKLRALLPPADDATAKTPADEFLA